MRSSLRRSHRASRPPALFVMLTRPVRVHVVADFHSADRLQSLARRIAILATRELERLEGQAA